MVEFVAEAGGAVAGRDVDEACGFPAGFLFEFGEGAVFGGFAGFEAAGGEFEDGFADGDAVLADKGDFAVVVGDDGDAAAVFDDLADLKGAVVEACAADADADDFAFVEDFVVVPGFHGAEFVPLACVESYLK